MAEIWSSNEIQLLSRKTVKIALKQTEPHTGRVAIETICRTKLKKNLNSDCLPIDQRNRKKNLQENTAQTRRGKIPFDPKLICIFVWLTVGHLYLPTSVFVPYYNLIEKAAIVYYALNKQQLPFSRKTVEAWDLLTRPSWSPKPWSGHHSDPTMCWLTDEKTLSYF